VIGRQPEGLAVNGPIVLALLDHRVPDAHRRLEQAVLYQVGEIAAGQTKLRLNFIEPKVCLVAQRHCRARLLTTQLFEAGTEMFLLCSTPAGASGSSRFGQVARRGGLGEQRRGDGADGSRRHGYERSAGRSALSGGCGGSCEWLMPGV
jgi:hypothetical protein